MFLPIYVKVLSLARAHGRAHIHTHLPYLVLDNVRSSDATFPDPREPNCGAVMLWSYLRLADIL